MEPINLLLVSIVAFAAVFVLLTVLALIMRVIVSALPYKESKTDAALYAAITSTYQSVYPGTKVTRIEELP